MTMNMWYGCLAKGRNKRFSNESDVEGKGRALPYLI